MCIDRKLLSIANIVFAVESEVPFALSERCIPFKLEGAEPDVVVRLREKPLDRSGYSLIYQGDLFDLAEKNDEIIKIRFLDERKDQIIWSMREIGPDDYEIFPEKLGGRQLDRINPLFFFNLSEFLIGFNAMVLHGAAICSEERGIIFTAASGTGKSTQADLWNRYRGAEIINGDRAIIRKEKEYRVYGSPYAGSSQIYKQKSARLSAIVVLKQAPFNRVRRIWGKQAYLQLLSQMSVSRNNERILEQQSVWLESLIQKLPIYLLECLPNEDAVDVLDRELKGK